ncbi:MAG TPA: glycosyltransferase [Burkholderiales bacterium]|nr:glycosyltransferase [Burkholderiales bacterium]
MNGTSPLVLVLIPVYGGGEALRASLASLSLARLPERLCTLVVDDGSDPPIAEAPAHHPRLGLHVERLARHAGIEAALNRGLEIGRELGADYIARLDAGDTIHPDRLVKQLEILQRDGDVGIVGTDAWFVDEQSRPIFRFETPRTDGQVRRRMHLGCCLLHPTVMIRRSAIEQAGTYSPEYPAAEDYDLFFRLIGRTRAATVPEPLTTKVLARDSVSLTKRRTQLRSRLRVQRRHFDPGRWESYAGVALTLSLFLIPNRLVIAIKRLAGISRI